MMNVQYLNVVTPGPLIIVRVPWPMPMRWREFLTKLTPIMHDHDGRQKDISSVDGLTDPERKPGQIPEDDVFAERMERAYAGATDVFAKFWLYDWRPQQDGFVLVREAAREVG